MHCDMANTKKSWLGAPVTNYIASPYASYNGSAFVNFGYNYANLGATYTYVTGVDNPINSPGVLEYYTGTDGYKYFSIDSQTLPTTGTYTFSYYARLKVSGGASNKPIDNQLWRANGSDRSVTGDWNPTFTSNWVRYSTTGPAEASTILQYFPVHSGLIYGGYTIQYCGFQLELGSVATPFVVGTRSSTQSVADLTNNNSITATSLTYNSDGTFSFDGNSNYIQSNSSCGITSSVTLSAIIKPSYSGQTGPHSTIICTDVDYPYGAKLMNYKNSARYGLWLGFSGTDNYEAFVSADINDNTIKMLTASWDRSTGIVNIYLNGVLQSSISTAKTIPTVLNTGKITLGTDYNSIGSAAKNKFLGNIYYASIYDRALSAAEVAQNFNTLRGRYGI